MSAEQYKRQHVRWMEDRADGLSDEEEAARAEEMDDVWRMLSVHEREQVEKWLAEQVRYRAEHGMPDLSHGIEELTPDESAAVMFEGEYDLILAEDDTHVVFQIHGREVKISRGILLDYDEEGRFWLAIEDAEEIGMIN